MKNPFDEKRREPRQPANGNVAVDPQDPIVGEGFEGMLVDVSAGGFRARHQCPSLYPGLVVSFRHAKDRGQARVVWNRILGEEVESGFLVLAGV
jgi:hypothetical protein